MKVLVIGGVAGGATAAARARRLSEQAEITVLERGPHVSFANCGLPYFLSGDIGQRSQLLLQTPEGFLSRYGIAVHLHTEALAIDREARRVRALGPEGERWYDYDRLILAQGGSPIMPPVAGIDQPHVFRLWTVPDMDRIEAFLTEAAPRHAVVAGGGFIGLEMAEAFHKRGLAVTVVELASQILMTLDREFAERARQYLQANGIAIETGVALQEVLGDQRQVVLSDGRRLPADLVLFSVGVRPELTLVKQAGLAIGASGGLQVDEYLRTSDPHIWAAGDMVEVLQRVSGRRVRVPLAGPANRQGRVAATNALGGKLRYDGALGTSVVKLIDMTAASTGLTEKATREAGYDVSVAVVHKDHHAGYYPGGRELSLKLVVDRRTARLLGAQGFGPEGVDKRIDVAATALLGKLSVDELAELDLAYAPPYSSANDPLNLAAFVVQNDLSGFSPILTPAQAAALPAAQRTLIDVRSHEEFAAGHVPGALNIPVDDLRGRLADVPKDTTVLVHCKAGFRGHLALRILKEAGWQAVYNITGGYTSMRACGSFAEQTGPV